MGKQSRRSPRGGSILEEILELPAVVKARILERCCVFAWCFRLNLTCVVGAPSSLGSGISGQLQECFRRPCCINTRSLVFVCGFLSCSAARVSCCFVGLCVGVSRVLCSASCVLCLCVCVVMCGKSTALLALLLCALCALCCPCSLVGAG